MLPEFLWLRYFIEVQGFKVEEAVMYQYNLMDMLLKNNDILSSGNRMKHILIRYFLIKDIITMGYLKDKYYPTGKMLSNHFTKPFQGAAFQNFRTDIQGIP